MHCRKREIRQEKQDPSETKVPSVLICHHGLQLATPRKQTLQKFDPMITSMPHHGLQLASTPQKLMPHHYYAGMSLSEAK